MDLTSPSIKHTIDQTSSYSTKNYRSNKPFNILAESYSFTILHDQHTFKMAIQKLTNKEITNTVGPIRNYITILLQ